MIFRIRLCIIIYLIIYTLHIKYNHIHWHIAERRVHVINTLDIEFRG